jgi:hypothetical protein
MAWLPVKQHCRHNVRRGQSLVEVITALALFGIIAATVGVFTLQSLGNAQRAGESTTALVYAREGYEALYSIVERAWNVFSTSGLNGFGFGTDNTWTFSGSGDSSGQYNRNVTISSVQRDCLTGNVVASGGTTDVFSNAANLAVGYTPGDVASSTTSTFYGLLTHWNRGEQLWTTSSDWSTGSTTDTVRVAYGDGELELGPQTLWGDTARTGFLDAAGTSGSMNDVKIIGTIAVGVRNTSASANVLIIDIQDPRNPVLVGSTSVNGNAKKVAIDGSYAYIASDDNSTELSIVDYRTPAAPVVVGTLDLTGTADAQAIDVVGDRVYIGRVSSATAEVNVVNVSNRASPTISGMGSYENGSGNIQDLRVENGALFMGTTSSTGQFQILDVTNDASISRAGFYSSTTLASIAALDILGRRVYVGTTATTTNAEFFILDTSTTSSPTVLGQAEIGALVNGVAVNDRGYAFLSRAAIVHVYNVSNPASPTVTTSYSIGGTTAGLDVRGYTFVNGSASTTAEFHLYRGGPSGWLLPERPAQIDLAGSADGTALAYACNTLYVGTAVNASAAEFFTYTVTTSTSPVVQGSLEIGSTINGMARSRERMILALNAVGGVDVQVVDITTASAPVSTSTLALTGNPNALSVAAAGDVAYVGTATNGSGAEFFAVNMTTSTAPAISGSLEIGADVNAVVVSSTVAYIATSDDSAEFQIIDVTTSTTPVALGSLNLAGTDDATGVSVRNGRVYVTRSSGTADFAIIDVTSSAAPTLVSSLDLPETQNQVLVGEGNFVFTTASSTGIGVNIVDITSETAPVATSSISLLGPGTNIISGAYPGELFIGSRYDSGEVQTWRPGPTNTYNTSGTYLSPSMRIGSSKGMGVLSWSPYVKLGASQTISMQIAGAPDVNGSPGTFTTSSVYTDKNGNVIPKSMNNSVWWRVRVFLTSAVSTSTPVLHWIRLTFSP